MREWNDQLVFLRKIVEDGTDKSYGIHVARLASVPRPILERAKEILRKLEASELTPKAPSAKAAASRPAASSSPPPCRRSELTGGPSPGAAS